MGGNDCGVYLQRQETSQKRIFLLKEGVWVPDSPVGCFRGCHLNILWAANHLTIPSQPTAVTVYVQFFSPSTGLYWMRKYKFGHMFSSERGRHQRQLQCGPQARKAAPSGLKLWPERTWLSLNLVRMGRDGGGVRRTVTCPLQSQGSLKATYSSSLLYMPRLVLVGFLLASNWNCILAMLSKSLERWRWTWERKPWQRIQEDAQGADQSCLQPARERLLHKRGGWMPCLWRERYSNHGVVKTGAMWSG